MKVLVTGATGSFGGPLCPALAAQGIGVRAFARRRPANLPDGVEFVAGDVRDGDAVKAAVVGCDRVVHLAWYVGIAKDPAEAESINLGGTRNVIAAAQQCGVEKLVFSSSVMCYGAEPGHGPYREDDEKRPDRALQYGYHKEIVEQELQHCGIASVIVRPTSVVGRTVGSASVAILATPAIIGVRGEDHPLQFVHAEDVLRFMVSAVTDDRTGVVNLATTGTASLERVGEILGRRVMRLPAAALKSSMDVMFKAGLSEVNSVGLDTLRAFPLADTARLTNGWKFRPLWTREEALIDTRRAIAGVNLLGSVRLPRRGCPPLPPVGGVPDSRVDERVRQRFLLSLAAPQGAELADDILARSGGLRRPLSRRQAGIAARWAETETPLLTETSTADLAVGRCAARVSQLADLTIDLLTLAQGAQPHTKARERILGQADVASMRLRTATERLGSVLHASGGLPRAEDVWHHTVHDVANSMVLA